VTCKTEKSIKGIPKPRSRHSCSIYQDRLIFLGGHFDVVQPNSENQHFVSSSKSFQSKSNSPALARHVAGRVDEKLWIFGGQLNKTAKSNNTYCYEPKREKWFAVDPKGGVLPQVRSDHSGVAIGKYLYIFGGSNQFVKPLNDLWRFDTETLEWQELTHKMKGDIPTPRSGHSAAAINNKFYMFGGAVWNGKWEHHSNELFCFDTETFVWKKILLTGVKPTVSTFTSLISCGDFLILAGGGSMYDSIVVDDFKIIDPLSSSCLTLWNNVQDMDTYQLTYQLNTLTNKPVKSNPGTSDLKQALIQIREDQDQRYILKSSDFKFKSRGCISGGLIGSKLYLFGGFCGTQVNDFEVVEMNWINNLTKYESRLDQ
jgi:N-acetylneuraminic acid mutarotase